MLAGAVAFDADQEAVGVVAVGDAEVDEVAAGADLGADFEAVAAQIFGQHDLEVAVRGVGGLTGVIQSPKLTLTRNCLGAAFSQNCLNHGVVLFATGRAHAAKLLGRCFVGQL